MKPIHSFILFLVLSPYALAKEPALGNSVNQMIRLQTVDPLAENRIPVNSPSFSGKKASKSFKGEQKGTEQKKIKNKDIVN